MRKFLLILSIALWFFDAPMQVVANDAVPHVASAMPAASVSAEQMTKEERKALKAQRDSLKSWLKNARYYTNNRTARNFDTARKYLEKCLKSPLGKDNVVVYLQAANTEYQCFQTERNKPASNKSMDVKVIYASTSAGFQYYSKAYQMAMHPAAAQEQKKPLATKVLIQMRNEAYDLYRTTQGFRANAGYYYNQKDYKQAYTYFMLAQSAMDDEILTSYAHLNTQMRADFAKFTTDSIRNQLIYSCAVTAVQMGGDSLIIAELEKAKTTGIETNRIYQQLCQKYLSLADTLHYEQTLIEGDSAVSTEPWYAQNLLNLYLSQANHSKALSVIDEVIEDTPENAKNVELKGRLLDEAGRTHEAEQEYLKAIAMDSTLLISYSSLGRIYFNRAVEREQQMIEQRLFDEIYDECVPMYELALPFYNKAFENDKDRTDSSIPEAMRTILFKRFQSPKCKRPRPLIRRYNEVSKAYGWSTL